MLSNLNNQHVKRTISEKYNAGIASTILFMVSRLIVAIPVSAIVGILIVFFITSSSKDNGINSDYIFQVLSSYPYIVGVSTLAAILTLPLSFILPLKKKHFRIKDLFCNGAGVSAKHAIVLLIGVTGISSLVNLIILLISNLLVALGISLPTPDAATLSFQGDYSLFSNIVIILGICVILPICEELVFRGVLLHGLCYVSTGFAVVASSVFFGIYHIYPAQVVYAFLLGIALSALAVKTGSLILPIIAHCLCNGFSVLSNVLIEHFDIVWFLTLDAVFCIIAIIILILYRKPLISLFSTNKQNKGLCWKLIFKSPATWAFVITIVLNVIVMM